MSVKVISYFAAGKATFSGYRMWWSE